MESSNKRYKKIEKFLNKGYLEIQNLQSYIPDLYNTRKTNKWTTYNTLNRLQEFTCWRKDKLMGSIVQENDENDESELISKVIKEVPIHIRLTPILNTFHIIQDYYPKKDSNIWLPHDVIKYSNLCDKLYKINNTAYIDAKCSVLLSNLVDTNISPHFNSVYGLYNGNMEEFEIEFSREYEDLKDEKWFKKALEKKKFQLVFEKTCTTQETKPDAIDIVNIDELLKENNIDLIDVVKKSEENDSSPLKVQDHDKVLEKEPENVLDVTQEIKIEDIKDVGLCSEKQECESKYEYETDSNDDDSYDYENLEEVNISFNEMPVQIILMEKLDDTFGILIEKEITSCRKKITFPKFDIDLNESNVKEKKDSEVDDKDKNLEMKRELFFEKLTCWLFQICAGLTCANKAINFVHNDFHIHNIMTKKIENEYFYYSKDDIIFRIPTYNINIKFIDFGRSTFKYDNKYFIGDVYETDGDAEGLYDVVEIMENENKKRIRKGKDKNRKNTIDKKSKAKIPNASYDLPFFANSLLEEFEDEVKWPTLDNILQSEVGKLLFSFMEDDNGVNFFQSIKGFKLCEYIVGNFRKKKPDNYISHPIFQKYIFTEPLPENINVYHL
tara:strand:+ start:14927 stop:16759 length:1833 start_codon:yes stop_codon:yes gene_type:complete